MCGLVGLITKRMNGFSREQQDIFSTLLFVDTFRGKDGSGTFVVSNDGDVMVAKDAGMAPNFMESKEYDEVMRRSWSKGAAMIGHNRAATRGVVNAQNAHPFNVDNNIVLVHNGTMRGSHRKHADVEVDSHAIAHLIHEKGSVSEALSAFDGAYALIWYDVAKAELNFIRNDERPLFWMELEDSWVWSSEAAMLEFAAARCKATIKTPPTLLSEHMLQKFTLDNRSWVTTSEKVEVKKPVYVPQSYSGNNAFTGQKHGKWNDDFDWEAYAYGQPVVYEDERPPFRESAMSRIRSAEEWADERRDATAAQRHRGQQHPRHIGPNRGDGFGEKPGGAVVQLLPAPREPSTAAAKKIVENVRRMVSDREPPEFADCKDHERAMAVKLNKLINYGHFRDIVIAKMPYNTSVHCAPFDYSFVNGKDDSDGYYLYATPFDDEDVILRQFFSQRAVTEERMIQIAGCDYVYEFTLGNKCWTPIDPDIIKKGTISSDIQGFVIFNSNGAKLISSGAQNNVPH